MMQSVNFRKKLYCTVQMTSNAMMFGYPFMGRLKIIGLKIQNVTVTLEIA